MGIWSPIKNLILKRNFVWPEGGGGVKWIDYYSTVTLRLARILSHSMSPIQRGEAVSPVDQSWPPFSKVSVFDSGTGKQFD